MTTVATRLSINVVRSARARREAYVGPWLPEPLVEDPPPGPASRAELADSLSLALLVLLERLTPVERAACLLREVFGYEYSTACLGQQMGRSVQHAKKSTLVACHRWRGPDPSGSR
jgi:DNA-directed RNA polymerase specialized sigma24 family protein